MLWRMAAILYIKIKEDGKKVHEIHWWQLKQAGESEAGNSLGLGKKQNGNTCMRVNN